MPISPGSPAFAASGATVATTIAPGSVSSMRRTRGVTGTWPISQKPATRVTSVGERHRQDAGERAVDRRIIRHHR